MDEIKNLSISLGSRLTQRELDVSKNEEFCIKNEELRTKNKEFCI